MPPSRIAKRVISEEGGGASRPTNRVTACAGHVMTGYRIIDLETSLEGGILAQRTAEPGNDESGPAAKWAAVLGDEPLFAKSGTRSRTRAV
jgi:hypothetical protein